MLPKLHNNCSGPNNRGKRGTLGSIQARVDSHNHLFSLCETCHQERQIVKKKKHRRMFFMKNNNITNT